VSTQEKQTYHWFFLEQRLIKKKPGTGWMPGFDIY
jgi:hypothetical protein